MDLQVQGTPEAAEPMSKTMTKIMGALLLDHYFPAVGVGRDISYDGMYGA